MPAAYDTSSRRFDEFIAEICPVSRAETLKQMAVNIARDAPLYAKWMRQGEDDAKRKQEAGRELAKMPSLPVEQKRAGAKRRRHVSVPRMQRVV